MVKEIKYRSFKIPKRSGGYRIIEQPDEEGMRILKDKLIELQNGSNIKPSYFAHSFMKGRNIVTCARQHFGKKYVARMDIKDFFPSITLDKFNNYLYEVFGQKKSKEMIKEIEICFKKNKKTGKSYLPQGSPTSPFLSNAYMRHFDWRCAWVAYKKGITYNRYADDMYISSNELNKEFFQMIKYIRLSLEKIGLKENSKKRKIMKQGKRMNVVGIVINEKFNIPKKKRKIIRAIEYNAKRDKKKLTNEQKGLITFKNMVEKYDKFKEDNLRICGMIECANKI